MPAQQIRLGTIPNPPTTNGLGLFEQLQARVTKLESLAGISQPLLDQETLSHEPQTPLALRAPALSQPRQTMPTDVFPHAAAYLRTWLDPTSQCGPRASKAVTDLRQLHKSLKIFHREPSPSEMNNDPSHIFRLIPSQATCRVLTEIYFDNLEHCFRIFHRPTFDRQLNDFFQTGLSDSNQHFLPQLTAVLAIASLLGIQNVCVEVANSFDCRLVYTSVEYIHIHLRKLSSKELHTTAALQTRMILLMLRWMRLDKLVDLWGLSGQILRQALTMRMDVDPVELPPMPPLEAEIRRRLWMTLCEEDMMLSILCNMPCLVPTFTCNIPLNVNDSDLGLGTIPPSKSFDVWTDALCQVFLAQSIKQRLHACRDMQYASADRYNHVLEHTRSFENYLQNLPAPLRFNHLGDSASKAPARLMARMELDISMRRPLMQLYSPFFYTNDEADVFAEARAGYLQSCLMLTSYQDLFDPKYSDIGVERPQGYWDFFYNVYSHELSQSILGLCLEIQRLSTSTHPNNPVANHGFSAFKMPTYNKSSLIHSARDTSEPMVRRISHVGSNLKDLAYLMIVFSSSLSCQYDPITITETLEDLVMNCKKQLERDGVPVLGDGTEDADGQMWTPAFGVDEEWLTLPQLPSGFHDMGNVSMVFDPL